MDPGNRAALEAAIDQHPDQATNYLVLADLLQEHQDPRGELIVLSKNTDAASRARAQVLQHQIGPASPKYGDFVWFYGFVGRFNAIIDEDDVDWLRAFLDHPSLRHVTDLELDVACGRWDEPQWVPDLIAERPRPSWRSLTINSYLRGGNDPPTGSLELANLWAVVPRLETLNVKARYVTPGALASQSLHSLTVNGELSAEELQPLLELSAPNLRELELYDVGERFARSLADSPLGPQLEKLIVPYAASQEALRAKLPNIQFLGRETGDRYEQTGE